MGLITERQRVPRAIRAQLRNQPSRGVGSKSRVERISSQDGAKGGISSNRRGEADGKLHTDGILPQIASWGKLVQARLGGWASSSRPASVMVWSRRGGSSLGPDAPLTKDPAPGGKARQISSPNCCLDVETQERRSYWPAPGRGARLGDRISSHLTSLTALTSDDATISRYHGVAPDQS